MSTTVHQAIQEVTEEFIQSITSLLREAALQEIHRALGISSGPSTKALPAPHKSTYVKVKPKELDRVYRRVQTSKKPVTVKAIASTMGGDSRRARYVLGRLLQKKLVTSKALGKGTNSKVYLPAKT